MPREPRDQRRARNARTAQAWASWLNTALLEHEPPLRPADLVRKSNGAFGTGHTTKWTNGDNSASPEHVLLIARILDRDPVEALRAAGHHTIADQIVALVQEAIHGEQILARAKNIAETSDDRDAV